MATEQNPAGGEAEAAQGILDDLSGDQTFDQEFNAFLGHSFEDDDKVDESSEEVPADGEGPPTPPAAPPAEPKETPGTVPASAEPSAANGTPPAQPAGEQVDPADLAAVMGFAAPTAQTPPAASPAGTPAPASAEPAAPEPFAPFAPNFKLPQEIVAGIFEAEDTESRHQALVQLLSSFGNAVTQTIEQRILQHHAPAMQASFASAAEARTVAQTVNSHFYGTYEDLKPYVPAVKKAFEVIAAKNPSATYSPELAAQVANLARQALKAAGIQLAAPAAPATPTGKPAAPKKTGPKAAPVFEAGGARPGSFAPSDGNSPEALLTELTQFGF